MIVVFTVAVICVVIDQLTKYIVASEFALGESVGLIDGVFHFTYIRNEGAAFGSLSDARWIFMTVSVLLIVGIIAYAVWKKPKSLLQCLSLGLLLGGGIGNMIDRAALGYVIDFLDFCAFPDLWKWIFNFADAFVCVGTALLAVWILKYDEKGKKPTEESEGVVTVGSDDVVKGGKENDEAE